MGSRNETAGGCGRHAVSVSYHPERCGNRSSGSSGKKQDKRKNNRTDSHDCGHNYGHNNGSSRVIEHVTGFIPKTPKIQIVSKKAFETAARNRNRMLVFILRKEECTFDEECAYCLASYLEYAHTAEALPRWVICGHENRNGVPVKDMFSMPIKNIKEIYNNGTKSKYQLPHPDEGIFLNRRWYYDPMDMLDYFCGGPYAVVSDQGITPEEIFKAAEEFANSKSVNEVAVFYS